MSRSPRHVVTTRNSRGTSWGASHDRPGRAGKLPVTRGGKPADLHVRHRADSGVPSGVGGSRLSPASPQGLSRCGCGDGRAPRLGMRFHVGLGGQVALGCTPGNDMGFFEVFVARCPPPEPLSDADTGTSVVCGPASDRRRVVSPQIPDPDLVSPGLKTDFGTTRQRAGTGHVTHVRLCGNHRDVPVRSP